MFLTSSQVMLILLVWGPHLRSINCSQESSIIAQTQNWSNNLEINRVTALKCLFSNTFLRISWILNQLSGLCLYPFGIQTQIAWLLKFIPFLSCPVPLIFLSPELSVVKPLKLFRHIHWFSSVLLGLTEIEYY